MTGIAVIIMGSERDLDFCRQIAKHLKELAIDYEFRVASAHKTPMQVLAILKEFEEKEAVYITVAGRSNALSAFVDSSTVKPVIACPPYSEKYSGADIFSSLRVPSGIGTTVTIEPDGAALATAKIFALTDKETKKHLSEYQSKKKNELEKANETIKQMK